jgi:hypothetical protein
MSLDLHGTSAAGPSSSSSTGRSAVGPKDRLRDVDRDAATPAR